MSRQQAQMDPTKENVIHPSIHHSYTPILERVVGELEPIPDTGREARDNPGQVITGLTQIDKQPFPLTLRTSSALIILTALSFR